jgi:iron-sulfur cluster assembly accessory protein
MYTLDYIDTPAANDRCFQVSTDLAVYVASEDLPMVAGTEVDLVTEGLNTALRFKNPNAESHCGCGESFSVASAEDA